jgi:hypothetical protein
MRKYFRSLHKEDSHVFWQTLHYAIKMFRENDALGMGELCTKFKRKNRCKKTTWENAIRILLKVRGLEI